MSPQEYATQLVADWAPLTDAQRDIIGAAFAGLVPDVPVDLGNRRMPNTEQPVAASSDDAA